MSAVARPVNPQLPVGAPETRRYSISAPSGLNVRVLAQDDKTKENVVNLSGPNSILRATFDQNISDVGTNDYQIDFLRDGFIVFSVFASQLAMDLDFVPEVFPINVQAGQYQIGVTQVKGTAAARKLTITWQTRLV